MLNINFTFHLMCAWGGGLIINKGIFGNWNFIFLLTLITLWVYVYCVVINKSLNGLLAQLNILLFSRVLLCIKTKSLLLFYIFFELSVLPITLIVFLFGYQPEKLRASLSLLLYTVVSGLPLLLFILYMKSPIFIASSMMAMPITLRFIVKTPMYLLHTWLPKAHVEAPVAGSMVLASVLLKLGSYGLLLFLPFVKMNSLLVFYLSMACIGSLVGSFICLRQGDIKILIAYSSVVHIGVVTIGLVSGREIGYTCGLMIILSHGLSSPLLFAYSYSIYESSHSRMMINNSMGWPTIYFRFLFLIRLNIGVPPRLGLWAEVLIATRILSFISCSLPILILLFFTRTLYNLYLFTTCMHNKFTLISKPITINKFFPIIQTVVCGYISFFCLDLFHI